MALAATVAVGLCLTVIYYLWSGEIVTTLFSENYSDPGVVLPLVGIATTLYAAISIWLSYALSLQRNGFVIGLAFLVLMVIIAMAVYHSTIAAIVSIMICAGILGNILGALTTLRMPEAEIETRGAPLIRATPATYKPRECR